MDYEASVRYRYLVAHNINVRTIALNKSTFKMAADQFQFCGGAGFSAVEWSFLFNAKMLLCDLAE